MMSSILKSPELNSEYEISMAYRKHAIYQKGLYADYSEDDIRRYFIPLRILSHATLFHHLNMLTIPFFFKLAIKLPFVFLNKLGVYWLWNSLRFAMLLWMVHPDVLHINNGGYPGSATCTQLAIVASIFGTTNIVYQVNNLAKPNKTYLAKFIDHYLGVHCEFVTASQCARSRLISRGFPPQKVNQVYNTAPIETKLCTRKELLKEWNLSESTIVLTQVGFLSERKGQHLLLASLSRLLDQDRSIMTNVVLFLVGDGEDQRILQSTCEKNGLNKYIRFTGYRNDSIKYIANCDVYVHPSQDYEDMPLAVLSAMNHGKTIIATRLSGIEEQIQDGESGILIDPNKSTFVGALAQAISERIKKPNNELGRGAKNRYDELFSNTVYARSLIRLYQNFGLKTS